MKKMFVVAAVAACSALLVLLVLHYRLVCVSQEKELLGLFLGSCDTAFAVMIKRRSIKTHQHFQ